MKDQTKHYLKVGGILGAICAVSGLLIGLTNLLTAETIERNVLLKKESSMKEIYDSAVAFSQEENLPNSYQYCKSFYIAYSDDAKTNEIGTIYYTKGSNAYGTISLMVGINTNGTVNTNIQIIENTQTYATTLEEEYILPYQANERELDDVKCGATYGAKLIKSMIDEAKTAYGER